MTATILLCVFSTLGFCLCARVLVTASAKNVAHSVSLHAHHGGFSVRARRIARGYVLFAVSLMGLISLFGAIKSYIELFTV